MDHLRLVHTFSRSTESNVLGVCMDAFTGGFLFLFLDKQNGDLASFYLVAVAHFILLPYGQSGDRTLRLLLGKVSGFPLFINIFLSVFFSSVDTRNVLF